MDESWIWHIRIVQGIIMPIIKGYRCSENHQNMEKVNTKSPFLHDFRPSIRTVINSVRDTLEALN